MAPKIVPAPVVFGWQVATTVVNRAWAGTVRGDDPHHTQRGHHQQDEDFHIHARNGGGDGQHRRSSAVVCAVVLANR